MIRLSLLALLLVAAPIDNAMTATALDPATFAEWVDGTERPTTSKRGPAHVVWTAGSQIEWQGLRYGDSKNPGPRHLRVGFKAPVPIGSVLTKGGGRLSMLKADAAYPGDLSKDDQWIPAERLGRDEAVDDEFSLWVLPPGTSTRALRFTHAAKPADPVTTGYLGGLYALPERLANIAPQAVPVTGARNEHAARLTNGTNDGTWAPGTTARRALRPISRRRIRERSSSSGRSPSRSADSRRCGPGSAPRRCSRSWVRRTAIRASPPTPTGRRSQPPRRSSTAIRIRSCPTGSTSGRPSPLAPSGSTSRRSRRKAIPT